MKPLKLASITALALAALTSAGAAGSYTPPAVSPPIMPPASMAHDWTGWYGDAFVGRWTTPPINSFFGANIGYNMSDGSLVYGGEVSVYRDPVWNFSNIALSGRVGATLSDNLLGFGRLGISRDISPATNLVLFGLGAQYAVSSNMYLRGEVVREQSFGGGGDTSLRVGAGWEF